MNTSNTPLAGSTFLLFSRYIQGGIEQFLPYPRPLIYPLPFQTNTTIQQVLRMLTKVQQRSRRFGQESTIQFRTGR